MSFLPGSAIPSDGYNINNSLRFRTSASAYLSRTPTVAGNSQIFTISVWVKRGVLGVEQYIYMGGVGNEGTTGYKRTSLRFNTTNTLEFNDVQSNIGNQSVNITSAVFRDPSAWYHIVAQVDTTQATSTNRVRLYVNGVLQTIGTLTAFALNYTTQINTTQLQQLGRSGSGTAGYLDGYLTEAYMIDGQALSASSFGSTNPSTGVWQPIKYTGTYGTNGFYQKYSNADSSAVLVNTSSAVQDTSATTITVNVPSGTVNNTLMILLVTSAGTANNWTTPAGWTVWSANFNGRAIYYRTASSEPASYTITQSGSATSAAYILTYNNATIDVMGSYGTAANPSVAPSITTTANNATVFYFVASGGQDTNTYSTPTNFTPLVSDLGPTRPCSAAFSRVQATAGATGTASSTIGSGLPLSLQFAIKPISNTNLGLDFSGNGNNYSTTNISVTAGATYDAMTDSPTNTSATVANYCVLNPLDKAGFTIANGNLSVTAQSGASGVTGSIALPSSGKWYWECINLTGTERFFGVINTVHTAAQLGTNGTTQWVLYGRTNAGGNIINKDGVDVQSGVTLLAANNVIGIAYNADAGTIQFYNNNSAVGTAVSFTTGITYVPWLTSGNNAFNNFTGNANFGQQPFVYTPPTGFNRLNTFNLPTSTVLKGNTVMDATIYAGNSVSPTSITNAASFRPDFVWIKNRGTGAWNLTYDSVRGATNTLFTNTTNQNDVNSVNGYLSAFNSNGFAVSAGSTSATDVNTTGNNYVAWQWQAGQGSSTSNTSGTITSTVSVNATAGFSIVTYTGTGSAATVGHGLGVAPRMIIAKTRSAANNWPVYHTSIGAANAVRLDLTLASAAGTQWNSTAPTSSVFSIGTATETNQNGTTYVAYCWAEISGFSNFGSYIGNGNADGPFVYTGFRPKFVLIKNSGAAADWRIYDTSRSTINVSDQILFPNTAGAEGSGAAIDIVSNGFKLRNTVNNGSANTYIYAAFAENPFKNALAR